MKIELKPTNRVPVVDVSKGDCFKHNEELYMRIEHYPCSNDIRMVNLRTGLIACLPCFTEVEPVKCKIVEDK